MIQASYEMRVCYTSTYSKPLEKFILGKAIYQTPLGKKKIVKKRKKILSKQCYRPITKQTPLSHFVQGLMIQIMEYKMRIRVLENLSFILRLWSIGNTFLHCCLVIKDKLSHEMGEKGWCFCCQSVQNFKSQKGWMKIEKIDIV